MKPIAYRIAYWTASIVLVAVVLSSLSYTFPDALFLGTLFLPGALVVEFFLSKASFEEKGKGIRNSVFVGLAVLIGEGLLLVLGNMVLSDVHRQGGYIYEVPDILVNPVFIAFLIIVLESGDVLLGRWLEKRFPAMEQQITFISDRQHVTLVQADILYIESNDTEVRIYATEGRCFRNKTPISQWENLLGKHFVRIHRSYLVGKSHITAIDNEGVHIADTTLPISRKYRETLKALPLLPPTDEQ